MRMCVWREMRISMREEVSVRRVRSEVESTRWDDALALSFELCKLTVCKCDESRQKHSGVSE